MMKQLMAAVVASTALLASPGALHAASAGSGHCALCGRSGGGAEMDVVRKDGTKATYACPKCGFAAEKMTNLKSAVVTDFFTRKKIDARKAFYVVDSEVGACCPPYWLAFDNRDTAEKFVNAFDGEVMTVEEAMEWLKDGDYKEHDPEHERYRRPYHDESHEHDWDR